MQKKIFSGLILSSMLIFSSTTFAFSLNDAANAANSIASSTGKSPIVPEWLTSIAKKLNITPEQAAGASAALLGLAKNNLSTEQFSSLTSSVPGINTFIDKSALVDKSLNMMGKKSNLNGLIDQTKTMDDAKSAFSDLKIPADTATKIAPTLLTSLKNKGLDTSKLDLLSNLWE